MAKFLSTICALAIIGAGTTLQLSAVSELEAVEERTADVGGELWTPPAWLDVPSRGSHNLVFSIGHSAGEWKITRIGEQIKDLSVETQAVYGRMAYAFSLPIWGMFQYNLGTTLGYRQEYSGDTDILSHVESVQLPGFHLGLLLNSTLFRLEFAYETYLDWIREFSVKDEQRDVDISVTLRCFYDYSVNFDYFYSRRWGVRLEWHQRKLLYTPPRSAEGQVVDSDFFRRDRWLGLGSVANF